jgi:glycosyltransferase involved in cell wall biosynthesis
MTSPAPAATPSAAVCTAVCAATARAGRALVDTLAGRRPGGTVLVLDLDGTAAGWTGPGVAVLRADDVVGAAEVHHAVALHGEAGSLAWLRPLALVAALERADAALWLDPTSLVLDALDDVAAAPGRAGVALAAVPRCPVPLPDDGAEPTAADLAAAGAHSPSILAATTDALPELRRWAQARRDAAATADGLDDLLARLPHVVLDDDGLAVSAWTLGARPLEGTAQAPRVGRAPVRHLDLAGFDPERPWVLDAAARRPRALLSTQPVLAALLAAHAARLVTEPAPASPYATLADGTPFSAVARHAYRLAAGDGATRPPDPFDADHPGAFTAWLTAPVPGTMPPLSRYLQAARDARPDLRAAFPDVPGADVAAFLAWADDHGRHELDAALVDASLAGWRREHPPAEAPRSSRLRAAARRVLAPAPHGVNVVGYLRGELGIGESARLVLQALATTDVRHAATSVSRHLASREHGTFTGPPPPRTPYDTTLICVNADLTPAVTAQVPELVHGRRRIGMWYWEVEEFPASLHGAFASVDEVWVATDFVRDAIARHSPVPVHTVPPPLPQPRATTTLTRADLGLPDGFVFLFSFDYLSTAERKNPLGLVEAFRRAFPRGSGPTLVIKSINAGARTDQAERLRLAVAEEPDVVLLEEYLDADARDALTLLADCYVSLHRAEGLGLTMAEAMALGKPVIASAYGGNLQFMTPENSWLVPAVRVPIPAGCDPYPAGSPWGEPDLDAAAAAMRAVVADPADARARAARAAHDIATLHSPAVAGRRMAARLQAARRG